MVLITANKPSGGGGCCSLALAAAIAKADGFWE